MTKVIGEKLVEAKARTLNLVFSFLVAYGLLWLIAGKLSLLTKGGYVVLDNRLGALSCILALLIFVLFSPVFSFSRLRLRLLFALSIRDVDTFRLSLVPGVFVFALLVLIGSDFVERRYIFYSDSRYRSLIFYSGLIASCLLLGIKNQAALFERKFPIVFALLAIQIGLALIFYQQTGGKLVFSDDHPAFLYRLQLLREHFPNIPFYSPDWNAGKMARDFFAVGVLGVFAFTWPFLYAASDFATVEGARLYTLLIPYLFLLIVPWSVFFAARILRLSLAVAAIASLLALGPSLGYFEWLLKYGTLGFCFSAGLFPLAMALAIRTIVDEEEPTWILISCTVFVSGCCLSWPPAITGIVPLLITAFFLFILGYRNQRLIKAAVMVFALIAIFSPWVKIFGSEEEISRMLSRDALIKRTASRQKEIDAAVNNNPIVDATVADDENISDLSDDGQIKERTSLVKSLSDIPHLIRELVVKMNPLILLFGLPGLFLLPRENSRNIIIVTVIWLFILAAGANIKPSLELHRMVIIASFLLSLPAALGLWMTIGLLHSEIKRSERNLLKKLVNFAGLVLLLGATAMTPVTVGAIYSNRSTERYILEPPLLSKMVEAIKVYGGNGRTFFLGFILHEFGSQGGKNQDGGHIAPLATFTRHPLYAFGFVHRHWFARDPIPESYRKREAAGIEEFLDLVNVSSVVTFIPTWTSYCRANSKYREVFKFDRFHLFVRQPPAEGYFLKGEGTLDEAEDSLVVMPKSEEIILKYRYINGLKVLPEGMAEIESKLVFEEEIDRRKLIPVRFIKLIVKQSAIDQGIKLKITL